MSRESAADRRGRLIAQVAQAIREYGSANDAMDAAAAERLGVNRTDLAVIDLLDRRGPLTAGGIAGATGLTTGAITAVLDRLEKMGYARRLPHPADRRRVVVEQTPKVRKLSEEIYGPLAEMGYKEMSRYTDKELELLRDVMLRARDLLVSRARQV